MNYTLYKFQHIVIPFFWILLPIFSLAQDPCDTNISMATAKNIEILDQVESCVSGCSDNMPMDSTTASYFFCKYKGAASWFKFKSYNLNSLHISVKSKTLKNLKYIILNDTGKQVDCNVISFEPALNKEYFIVVFEPDMKPGDFEVCIVGYNSYFPNYQSLQVTSTNLGSPLNGPYKPGEKLIIRYQNNYVSCGGQYLHFFMPIYGQTLADYSYDAFNLVSYNFEDENAEFREVYSDELGWKPDYSIPNMIKGIIESSNVPCILGTPNCIPMDPGFGKCSNNSITKFKAGWAFMTQGCNTGPDDPPQFDKSDTYKFTGENGVNHTSDLHNVNLDPNFSWGLKQTSLESKWRTLSYEFTIPIDIKERINQYETDEFYIGFTTFTDGQTGGDSYIINCKDQDITYLNLDIVDCTNNNEFKVNDTVVCSRNVFELNYTYNGIALNYYWYPIESKNVNINYYDYKYGPNSFKWSFENDTKEVGFVKMVSYAIDSAYCTSVPDTFMVIVNPTSVYAGYDTNKGSCFDVKLNGVAIGPSEWTTTGDGYFVDKFDPKTTYIKGDQDSILGNVTLNLRLLDTTGVLLCNGTNDDLKIKFITSKLTNKTKDFEICKKDTVITLFAIPGTGTWEGPGMYGKKFYPNLVNFGTHKILYKWRDNYGCNYVDTLTIEITNCLCILNAELMSTPAVCSQPTGSLEVKNINIVQGPFHYYWNTTATTSKVNNLSPGIYNVTVYYAGQCSLIVADTVKDNGNKFALLDTTIENCQYKLCVNSAYTDDFSVSWNNGSSEKCLFIPLTNDSIFLAEAIAYQDCRDTLKFTKNKNIIPINLEIDTYLNIVHGYEGYVNIYNSGSADSFSVTWYKNDAWFSSEQNIKDLNQGTYICVAEDAYGCQDTLEIKIYKIATNGTIDQTHNPVQVFPNPTNAVLNIIFDSALGFVSKVKLVDVLGKTFLKNVNRLTEDTYQLDCSDLVSGIYTIQIGVEDQLFQTRFMVVK